ncbi:MAG TPA: hypothetical protein ENH11_02685 [Candidatus Acetothermia bacterium]|nr:hypothetical protein [Candidatus Acetothermia bacterium]
MRKKKQVLVVLSGWLKIWYITDPLSQRHETGIRNEREQEHPLAKAPRRREQQEEGETTRIKGIS